MACIGGCISGGDSSTYKGEVEDLALDTGLLPEGWYDHMEMATVDTCVPPIASAITIEVAHAYNPGNGYITARLFQNVTRATEGDAGSVYTTFVTGMVEQYGEAWHTQHEGTLVSPNTHIPSSETTPLPVSSRPMKSPTLRKTYMRK